MAVSDYHYQFGPFTIDTRERLLYRGGEYVTLKQKAVGVLLTLLAESPRVVEKAQFMREVWPDAFVEEGSLTVNISELRRALGGDAGDRRYIETIPRRGYRLVAGVERRPLDARVSAPPHGERPEGQAQQAAPVPAVAVLPFANIGSDPALEYLSDGLSESIINSLSQLSGVRVRASGSSFRYRGEGVDPLAAARELGVDRVVQGRVMQLGERYVVRASLVDAADGAQLWGEQYERDFADLLEVQREIAGVISERLRLWLTADERRRLARPETVNAEAYRAYLRGRHFWSKRPHAGFLKALDFFQRAIELDPSYAPAYAGLADAYGVLGSWEAGLMAPREAAAKARAAALRALDIDDELAEAHTSLAYVKLHYDWDVDAAGAGFRRAIELKPNYVHAHHWYSHYCVAAGRADEALAVSLRALDLDPLDLIINIHMAWHYWMVGQPEGVHEQCARALEVEPDFLWSHFFGGLASESQGRLGEAVAQLRAAARLSSATTFACAGLGHALALSGAAAEARRQLAGLRRLAAQQYVPAYDMAVVHLGLGESDEAFAWLEKALEERSSWMVYLNVEPRWGGVREDPRFRDLQRRVGRPG
jgi:TolB-like protein